MFWPHAPTRLHRDIADIPRGNRTGDMLLWCVSGNCVSTLPYTITMMIRNIMFLGLILNLIFTLPLPNATAATKRQHGNIMLV